MRSVRCQSLREWAQLDHAWDRILPVSLEDLANRIQAAAQQLREAQKTLPIGWEDDLNLHQVVTSLEQMALAVRQGKRKAAIDAKRLIMTRGEAASLVASLHGRDASADAKSIKRKKEVAQNASKAWREKAIKKKNGNELREILAVARSGRPIEEVALEYWIREVTLKKWLEEHQSVTQLASKSGSGG